MNETHQPAIFLGHGSPTIAIENSPVTEKFAAIGKEIIKNHGKPKAILMISAHWLKSANRIQSAPKPRQIYDFYGFQPALYAVKYEPEGCPELTEKMLSIKDLELGVDDSWGIDHGAWTPLVHMFPEADIPVAQLSLNGKISPSECFRIGQMLSRLRSDGYLIMGSGNIVHNLWQVDWGNPGGSAEAESFNNLIVSAVERGDYESVIDFRRSSDATFAVPTTEHFLPLLYVLGAAGEDKPLIFNNLCTLGSIAMTGFAFGI